MSNNPNNAGVPNWALSPSQQQQQQQQQYNPQQQQSQAMQQTPQQQYQQQQQRLPPQQYQRPPPQQQQQQQQQQMMVPQPVVVVAAAAATSYPQQQQQQPAVISHGTSTLTPPPSGGMTTPVVPPQSTAVVPATANISNSVNANASAPLNNRRRRHEAANKVLVTRTADEETEDGRIRNREAMSKIRDAWVYKQVRERVREFTEYRQATFFVGTWNVNAKGKEESLQEWICGDWYRHNLMPDVVAVGFQEIVDLNAVNVAVGNKTEQRSKFWSDQLLHTLNPSHNQHGQPVEPQYALVMQRSLVGLLICLFVKVQHRHRCKAITSDSVGVGVMGMMGNKGGVSVRLQFYDSNICFICSHLAAHRENVAGRNADFLNVLQKTNFEIGEDVIRETVRSGSMSQWGIGGSGVGIADHDVIFWLGDLNYRIDESMPTEKVLELSVQKQLDPLRPLDQLNVERREGRAFQGFEEGVLNFVPTYKYQPGTDVYEQRPEKKLRAPAWCDRILWMNQGDPQHVQQLTYNRSETPNCSDHKPVYSTLRLTVKDVVLEKREGVYNELLSLLDQYENESLPMVGLDTVELDFGAVRYERSVTLPIRITNTGQNCAQYRFVPKLDENHLCKSWMAITPTYGLLIPGEKAATINVTVTIDNKTAQLLNGGREVLNDILILRLENGRDYYITVKGTYARSCFGMSLDEMVLYKDTIRTIPLDPIERAEQFTNESEISPSSALCIPKELWRVVDAIYEKGLQTPDLFFSPGIPTEVSQIREALDTGSPFSSPHSIHSYVECFTKLLLSLPAPVIPSSSFPMVEINSENIQSMSRKFLEVLTPVHYNVLVYVMSFFREVLLYKERNGLTAAKIARICCQCCSPSPVNVVMESSMVQRQAGMHLILLHLLETSSI
eukprot:CAMPEP_0168163900 /NCGR_PEP_ID=MMETSP0139_2-20121125/633_1 /TAXON_ID=44445 /ORGANISM="Pseudo-nitzschia australis, Strain 10249 10 AB" /LENGTH=897 /DNA_ID=CAMNT_0008080847 /DNA_START=170 /DNA_END=2863 /DNA_ORIENTATION=-